MFFVEAALGLVAKHLALEHVREEIRQLEFAALVANVLRHVADHVAENVEPDQIDGAESRRLRPSHGGSGQRIHVFDREIHLLHQPHDVQNGKCPDAVGDEVRRVFRNDDALSQMHVAAMRNRFDRRTDPSPAWE